MQLIHDLHDRADNLMDHAETVPARDVVAQVLALDAAAHFGEVGDQRG
jgi:hypothetical protein